MAKPSRQDGLSGSKGAHIYNRDSPMTQPGRGEAGGEGAMGAAGARGRRGARGVRAGSAGAGTIPLVPAPEDSYELAVDVGPGEVLAFLDFYAPEDVERAAAAGPLFVSRRGWGVVVRLGWRPRLRVGGPAARPTA